MLVDTHAHLDFPKFDQDRQEVIQRAQSSDLKYIINVGADEESSQRSVKLAQQEEMIYAAVGVHPHDASKFSDTTYNQLQEWAAADKVVAIGETGLDYHYDNSPRQLQQEVFRRQIQLAKEVELPLIIHSREAKKDSLDILLDEGAYEVGGIIHCFGGDLEMAEAAIDMNFYIAVGGLLTFDNAHQLRRIIKQIPIEKLLVETDAPYLTPQPHRGKRNEPAYVKHVVDKLAHILPYSAEKIGEVTTANAKELLGIN